MQKILLYIDNLYLGGAQRVMANLANHFASDDLKVVMINDFQAETGKNEYPISSNIKRYFLEDQIGSPLRKQFHRLAGIRKITKEENPDIVLSFLGPTNLRMLIATIGLKPTKYVSVRNDPYKEYGSNIKRIIACTLFRLCDGCVFQTKEAAQYFPKSVQKKSEVIFNPVSERFYHVDRNHIQKEIISVGRLQPQKNPMLLLEAFGKLAKKYPDYSLIYYGEGELQPVLAKKAKELQIDNQVVFYGQVSDIAEKQKTASIYVLSSDFEGMPNALMEAMAAGIPVISTDCPCGGPKSLITNRDQGILVPCNNSNEMAEALEKLVSDPKLREKMGAAAHERACEFKTSNILRQWDEFLKIGE